MLLNLTSFLEKRERIEFAVTVNKYDRRFKVGCIFDEIIGNLDLTLDFSLPSY